LISLEAVFDGRDGEVLAIFARLSTHLKHKVVAVLRHVFLGDFSVDIFNLLAEAGLVGT